MIVTGHQINFLPGCSVLEKLRAADAVIWLDQVQFSKNGFVNRNRFSDGSWLTVPVADADTFAPINRVRIADATFRARKKLAKTLRQRLGVETAEPYVEELLRPYKLLVGLNWGLLRLLQHDLEILPTPYLQSHLEAGHPVPVVSDDDHVLRPVRDRLAAMVAEIGGTVWLSGPSGRNYLSVGPFEELGIEVRYFEHDGPNPTALEMLYDRQGSHTTPVA